MWSDAVRVTDICKRSRCPLLSFFLPFPSSCNNLFPCFPNKRRTTHFSHNPLVPSCRCTPPTHHRPHPAAVRCLLAAVPVLPLRAARSPLSLSLSCLLPGAHLTLRHYTLLHEPNSPSGGRTPKVSNNPEPLKNPPKSPRNPNFA